MNRLPILSHGAFLVAFAFASLAKAEPLSVRSDRTRFREAASTSSDVLFTADRFYPVDALERHDGWVKVKDFEGEIAWVKESLLDDKATVVVTLPRVRGRNKPSASGRVVFDAKRSDAFPLLETNGNWVKVQGPGRKQAWLEKSQLWGALQGANHAKKP